MDDNGIDDLSFLPEVAEFDHVTDVSRDIV